MVMQNLSLLEKLMTIEEAPDEQLQAPGQLSDADEPEPWMPTAGKRKAARRINFGNHQPPANGDQDRQEEAAEPASGDDPADLQADDPAPANKKGRQSTAVRDTRNPEQGQPISKLPSDSKHAPSGLAKQSKDAVQHAQQLCLTGDKAAGRAETVRISATAHRHLKEAAQEGQGYEGPSDGDAGGIDPQKSKRRSSRKPGTATHQDSQAAAGRHAGANQRHADADQRDRQEVLNQFNATADEGSQHTPARDKRAQPKKAPQVNTAAAMGGLQTSSRPNRTPTRLANQVCIDPQCLQYRCAAQRAFLRYETLIFRLLVSCILANLRARSHHPIYRFLCSGTSLHPAGKHPRPRPTLRLLVRGMRRQKAPVIMRQLAPILSTPADRYQ